MPQSPFTVTANDVVFVDNVTPRKTVDGVTGQPVTVWDYDQFVLPCKQSAKLEANIESNYAQWLQKAKDCEYNAECEKVRAYRDKLINTCDIKYCNCELWDLMDDTKKAEWRAYKQALRDIPFQEGFPYAVVFPKLPYVEGEYI